MSNPLAEVLHRLVIFERLVSAEQLADVAECSVGTLYAYLEGHRDVPWRRARRMHHYLARVHQRNDIAESLLTYGWSVARSEPGQANGQVDDEIAPFTEALGDLRKAHRDGDRRSFETALRRCGDLMHNLQSEARAL